MKDVEPGSPEDTRMNPESIYREGVLQAPTDDEMTRMLVTHLGHISWSLIWLCTTSTVLLIAWGWNLFGYSYVTMEIQIRRAEERAKKYENIAAQNHQEKELIRGLWEEANALAKERGEKLNRLGVKEDDQIFNILPPKNGKMMAPEVYWPKGSVWYETRDN